jgi:hypothetical protein
VLSSKKKWKDKREGKRKRKTLGGNRENEERGKEGGIWGETEDFVKGRGRAGEDEREQGREGKRKEGREGRKKRKVRRG